MNTLTMNGIANLASVQRPVVSMWRSRFADSDRPFPQPVPGEGLQFNAAEVADWLRETGLGNNRDAQVETALHSSAFKELQEDAEAASSLLLLHEMLGEPLAAIDTMDALSRVFGSGYEHLLDSSELVETLSRTAFVSRVDELVEAAFTGRAVLDRLVDEYTGPHGAWKQEALTAEGLALVASIARELSIPGERAVVPQGTGGLILARALLNAIEPDQRLRFGLDAELFPFSEQLIAWRSLAAHGSEIRISHCGGAISPESGRLVLAQQQAVTDPTAFFDAMDEILLELAPNDVALIVGPANLLFGDLSKEPALARQRSKLLASDESYVSPLRYVGALPKGLSRFGGRRELALWVLGHGEPHVDKYWTVYGEHRDTELSESSISSITADIATAIAGGPDLSRHAFHSSTMRETTAFLRQGTLRPPIRQRSHVDGAERLARIWELDREILPKSLRLQASQPDRSVVDIAWSSVVPALARDVPGHRVPTALFEYPVAPVVATVGPTELRNPRLIGNTTVNRLQVAAAIPHAEFSRPGDVIYTTTGQPAAWVDSEGGHLVVYPARILRLKEPQQLDRALHPQILARDIISQGRRDRNSWRFRTIPQSALEDVAAATGAIAERRQALEHQLQELTELEQELIDGLTAGVLSVVEKYLSEEN